MRALVSAIPRPSLSRVLSNCLAGRRNAHPIPSWMINRSLHNGAVRGLKSHREGHPDRAQADSPSAPLLLLEGNNYHVSSDGLMHTLYEMRLPNSRGQTTTIEEAYDIAGNRKKYTLRQTNEKSNTITGGLLDSSVEKVVEIEEIKGGMARGAGTGSTTWESSIAMSLFFASNPRLLRGDILELGSGVGLGGVLCSLSSELGPENSSLVKSVTLSDHNPQVLEQCISNIEKRNGILTNIQCMHLDWFDCLGDTRSVLGDKYDTIIASDCIYRSSDMPALEATIAVLLKDRSSRAHIFGPKTRGTLHLLIQNLQLYDNLSLFVDEIDLEKNRLARDPSSLLCDPRGSTHVSSSFSTILHVTVQLRSP